MPGKNKVTYEFGPFRLDLSKRILQRDGRMVSLPPKALDTLILLVRHHDEVLDKQTMMEALWGNINVEESNLTQQIFILRKALGDTANFIETVPRRGYVFTAQVTEHRPETDAGSAITAAQSPSQYPETVPGAMVQERTSPVNLRSAAILAVICVAVLLAAAKFLPNAGTRAMPDANPIRAIAVLPLENLTGDANQIYFVDGITDAVTAELARVGSLRVIARASVMQYRGSRKTIPQIGRELHVDAVVEGTVARSGDRVRVNAELIDARTDTHLWAQSYDRDLHDILNLQSDLASAIAAQVAANVTARQREELSQKRAVDPAAHLAYMKGRFAWNQRTEKSYLEAIHLFQESLSHDPSYAAAYAGLADAYALLGSLPTAAIARSDAMEKGRAAAKRAIALDPNLAEAHTSLAFILMHYDWKFAEAEKEFQLALQLNPSYATAHQWYAYDLIAMGRVEESLQENRRAQQYDPLSLIIATDRGELLMYAGKDDEAKRQFEEVIALDPNFPLAHNYLAELYARRGDFTHATAEADRALLLTHNGIGERLVRTFVAAKAGKSQQARRMLATLEPDAIRTDSAYPVASVYMCLGERDRAMEWLNRALQQREGSLILLRVDPVYRLLRSDRRFSQLLVQVGLPNVA